MRKIAEWIKRHKLCSGLILLAIFFLPILIVHLLFKVESGPAWLKAKWDAGDVLTYIAGFEAFIGTVSLGALSLWQNEQIHNEHIESLEPCLSMRLISVNHEICLVIENTGAIEAKEISISIREITDNGDNTDLLNNGQFGPLFELYPKETVQRAVAISGENIETNVFPQVKVRVSYLRPDIQRRKEYERSVIYDSSNDKVFTANTKHDNLLETDIKSIARSAIRVANYLDGHQLRIIDEIDLMSGESLRNDLTDALRVPIVDRSSIIHNGINGGNEDA